MRRPRSWSAPNYAALALLAVAAALAGAAGRRALARPLPAEPSWRSADLRPAAAAEAAVRLPVEDDAEELERLVLGVVARNPFRAARSRAGGRYRPGGFEGGGPAGAPAAAAGAPAPPPPPRPPLPQLRLAGVVVLGGGAGMAAIEVPGTPQRLVSVGESLEGMRLVSVTPTEARLSGRDTTVVLRLKSTYP